MAINGNDHRRETALLPATVRECGGRRGKIAPGFRDTQEERKKAGKTGRNGRKILEKSGKSLILCSPFGPTRTVSDPERKKNEQFLIQVKVHFVQMMHIINRSGAALSSHLQPTSREDL